MTWWTCWLYLAACWQAWSHRPAPEVQRAHDKRRLEQLLLAEGLSNRAARRVVAAFYRQDPSASPNPSAPSTRPAGDGSGFLNAGEGPEMKTKPPSSYQPMLLAMRAAAYGTALAHLHPDRPRPTLQTLAAMAEAHQDRMARVAQELRASPAAAAAARAKRMRDLDIAMAGLLPTSTTTTRKTR